MIMYNIVQDDKSAVKLELWVDKKNNKTKVVGEIQELNAEANLIK